MEYYTWVLTFHVMSFMSWMAMLFYQPRLYVYHSEHADKKEFVDVVKLQEYKMYKLIGFPAEIATIISGALLLYLNPGLLKMGYMHAKFTVVILLIAYSHSLEYIRVRLANESCKRSGNFFRAYNEVPTFLSLLIVTYVVTMSVSVLFTVLALLFGGFVIYKVYRQKPKSTQKG